jgi:hypothetical protein
VSGESVPDVPEGGEEPPPLLGSWRRIYALVLAELAVTVILLYVLARWAS